MTHDLHAIDKPMFASGVDVARLLLYAEIGGEFERDDEELAGEALEQRQEDRDSLVRVWANLMCQAPEISKLGMAQLQQFAGKERAVTICRAVEELVATLPPPDDDDGPKPPVPPVFGGGGYL